MIRNVELKEPDADVNNTKNQLEFGYIPLSKWNEFFAYPSVGSIRQLYFNAYKYRKTDFDTCIKRMGKRIYIDIEKFKSWLEKRKSD